MSPTGGVDFAQAQIDGRLVIDDDAPPHDGDTYVHPKPPEPPVVPAQQPASAEKRSSD